MYVAKSSHLHSEQLISDAFPKYMCTCDIGKLIIVNIISCTIIL